jgi:hypothetical protein
VALKLPESEKPNECNFTNHSTTAAVGSLEGSVDMPYLQLSSIKLGRSSCFSDSVSKMKSSLKAGYKVNQYSSTLLYEISSTGVINTKYVALDLHG